MFNNFNVEYTSSNKRVKEVHVSDNTFIDLVGAINNFVQVNFASKGTVYITNNLVSNCTASADLFGVNGTEYIIIGNNTFENVNIGNNVLLATDKAMYTNVNNLKVTNLQQSEGSQSDSLIKISSKALGHATFENAYFDSNSFKSSAIKFTESVGVIDFKHNEFSNDIIQNSKSYIVIDSPYSMNFTNCTFTNVSQDFSGVELTLLIEIKQANIALEGPFIISHFYINK